MAVLKQSSNQSLSKPASAKLRSAYDNLAHQQKQSKNINFQKNGGGCYKVSQHQATIAILLNPPKKIRMKKLPLLVLCLMSLYFGLAHAEDQFVGPNFSGIYSCKGENNKVGEYEVVATLKLNRISSHGGFGVYDFNTETENSLVYKGQAIANGYKLALTFNLSDSRSNEYSTGIADVQKVSNTRWAYTNHYYEPDENGGNVGSEYCVMQKLVKVTKLSKKLRRSSVAMPAQG